MIPAPVTAYWNRMFGDGAVTVGDALPAERPAMTLTTDEGTRAAFRTELAARLGILPPDTPAAATARLAAAGIVPNDPDLLFYAPDAGAAGPAANGVRRLTAADGPAFDSFQAAVPADERDEAWVELDHWAAFGRFDGDRLVAAASLYPWRDSVLADIGVLTLPAERGRGHARAVVHAARGQAARAGYEVQYRCRRDNAASVALARACGFVLLGEWAVVEADR